MKYISAALILLAGIEAVQAEVNVAIKWSKFKERVPCTRTQRDLMSEISYMCTGEYLGADEGTWYKVDALPIVEGRRRLEAAEKEEEEEEEEAQRQLQISKNEACFYWKQFCDGCGGCGNSIVPDGVRKLRGKDEGGRNLADVAAGIQACIAEQVDISTSLVCVTNYVIVEVTPA
jgi:hypothetical protein